jgi:hypothetical protein
MHLSISKVAVPAALAATALGTIPATSSAAGANPYGCPADTRVTRAFQIGGSRAVMELRYSAACQAGWARLTITGGPLGVSQSAWNPGGASQYNVPNANYTYTVDAPRGRQVCGGFHAYAWNLQGQRYDAGWFYAGCYTA